MHSMPSMLHSVSTAFFVCCIQVHSIYMLLWLHWPHVAFYSPFVFCCMLALLHLSARCRVIARKLKTRNPPRNPRTLEGETRNPPKNPRILEGETRNPPKTPRNLVSLTRNPKPETRNPKPAQKPGGLKGETRNPPKNPTLGKGETRNPKPCIGQTINE